MKTLFLGDISPTAISSPLFKEKNTGELFKDTVSVFNDKDFIFANLECALTDAVEQIKKFGPALKAPAETAAASPGRPAKGLRSRQGTAFLRLPPPRARSCARARR